MLAPTLASLDALHQKLWREFYRAFHVDDRLHKADHFYNFCVTAHSMRDYFFEHTGKVDRKDQEPFNTDWSRHPLLVAVQEIANQAKHFTLREHHTRLPSPARTRTVRERPAHEFDVYVGPTGRLSVAHVSTPGFVVILSDGAKHEMYEFMSKVLAYWRDFLMGHSIRLRRQPFARLHGFVTYERLPRHSQGLRSASPRRRGGA